jgi:hypothetical protein
MARRSGGMSAQPELDTVINITNMNQANLGSFRYPVVIISV